MNNKIIKVATWNVSEGFSASWNLNDGIKESPNYKEADLIKQIVEKINEYNLDIICFQEFPIEIDGQELLKEYIYKHTELKYYSMHATYSSFLFKGGEIGVAIFSKHNIISEIKTYFENPNLTKKSSNGKTYKSFDKGLILTKINLDNNIINVITGHAIAFSPFGQKAEDFPQSYKPLANLIINNLNNKESLIACGDFNTDHLFELIPEINNKVNDIVEGTTTPPVMEGENVKNGRKLDYILIDNNIKKLNVLKINNLSDHYLCIAEIMI